MTDYEDELIDRYNARMESERDEARERVRVLTQVLVDVNDAWYENNEDGNPVVRSEAFDALQAALRGVLDDHPRAEPRWSMDDAVEVTPETFDAAFDAEARGGSV